MGSSERVPEQKDASWINIFGLNVMSSDLNLMSLETDRYLKHLLQSFMPLTSPINLCMFLLRVVLQVSRGYLSVKKFQALV